MSLEITKTEETTVVSTPAVTPASAPAAAATTKPEDLKPGTPEYNAHMADVGRRARGEIPADTHETPRQESTETTTDTRPQWLPEKFKSPEDMAKAYSELEKKLGSRPADQQATSSVDPTSGDDTETVQTYEKYFSEIKDQGSLSEESYKALTAKFPKYLVDAHIELAQQVNELSSYRAAQEEAEVISTLGGAESFKQVSAWAAQNLTPSELEAFNKQVVTSKETAVLLLQGLKARMEASMGRTPTLVTGGTGGVTQDVFGSKADFQMAMADPRYSGDATYRQSVYEKLRRTKVSNPSFSVV